MTIKVFKLELAQSLVTDSTGNAIDDPTGIRIDKISRRRLVFVVRLIDPSWFFLEIQHQMESEHWPRIGNGGESGFVGCYQGKTSHGNASPRKTAWMAWLASY